MAGTELDPAKNDPVFVGNVDTAEVPSAAWGWSGEAPRAFKIAGIFVAFSLLIMLIGNHHGHVEDLYLIGFAVLIVGIIVRDTIRKRRET